MPDGLLLIDKPVGLRSTECVARVKRVFGKNTRVGHAGTLDSTASGLLVLLLGSATRLSDYIMKLPKMYEALVCLGTATDTCDGSGQVVFYGDATKVSDAAFDRVLCSFWGQRMQVPPEISALKTGGKPFHRLARAGDEVRPAARPAVMTSVKRISSIEGGYVKISVICGKGTYIRSLVRDIGSKLGCGAHIAELRRFSTGPFCVTDAISPASIDSKQVFCLRSSREAGRMFHRILLTAEAEKNLLNGLGVSLAEAGCYVPGTVELAGGLCVEGETMIGFADIVEYRTNEEDVPVSYLKPVANIPGVALVSAEELY